MTDITSELLSGASPFLSELFYDALKREVVLKAANNPEDMLVVRVITFPGITKYSESIEEIDDELIDGVIGIHWLNDSQICIKTDLREIIITLTGKPHGRTVT
jgi:hypothetical protein